MSLLSDIFGGSQQQSTSSSTPVNMNPLTSALSGPLANTLTSTLAAGAPQYTGSTQPTMTGAQNTSLTNLASAVAPGNNVNSYINNVLNGSYMPGGANGNPNIAAVTAATNLPIQEQLATAQNVTNPLAFSAAGQSVNSGGSSAFANAEALSNQSAANAMSANATQIANNAYNTGVTQMTAAANLQPQEVQSAINVLQAQLLPTLLQQEGITNGLSAFQDNVTALTSFLQTMTNAEAPIVGNSSTSQSTGSSQNSMIPAVTSGANGSNPLGNIAAALASL